MIPFQASSIAVRSPLSSGLYGVDVRHSDSLVKVSSIPTAQDQQSATTYTLASRTIVDVLHFSILLPSPHPRGQVQHNQATDNCFLPVLRNPTTQVTWLPLERRKFPRHAREVVSIEGTVIGNDAGGENALIHLCSSD